MCRTQPTWWLRLWLAPALLWLLSPLACGGAAMPAAEPAPAAVAAPEPAAPSRGFFHEIRSDTANAYLLGSVHLSRGDVLPMDEPIERAFERADTLVLELDLSEQGRMDVMTETLEKAIYPPGESLGAALDDETLELLRRRLDERGLPMAAVARFRPWLVAVTLTVLELQRAGYDAEAGVDLHFAKRAEGSKEIVGLESAAEQISIFADMTETEQVLMLQQTLESLDENTETLDRAMTAWRESDEEALEAEFLDPLRADPRYEKLYDAVFVERNVRMTERLEAMLRGDGTLFVVVGAAHLVGPDGIVARLRDAGYQVVPR